MKILVQPKPDRALNPRREMGAYFILTTGACLWLASLSLAGAEGVKPSASGEVVRLDDSSGVSVDAGVTTEVVAGDEGKMLKVDLGTQPGYPGVSFLPPEGGWDFRGYGGVQMKVKNTGASTVTMNLKIENEGDWTLSPWSVDMIRVEPGKTETLKTVFGKAFGQPAYKLDPSHISNVRVFITSTKEPASIVIGAPKLFKDEAALEAETVPSPAGPGDVPPDPPVMSAARPVEAAPTPLLDIAGKHDFPAGVVISDEAAPQLPMLGSLADFRGFPEADRHVYSFEVWPSDKDSLGVGEYSFRFGLGDANGTVEKVTVAPEGGQNLSRVTDAGSRQSTLTGIGKLDWGGGATLALKFARPVLACGVVLRSSGPFELRRFLWAGADQNGFPVSYTLSDGTVVNVGKRELRGALLKGDGDAFLGVVDRSGQGIVSVTYSVKGCAGNVGQSLSLVNLAFVTTPQAPVAPVINLKGRYDFKEPAAIAGAPLPFLDGLAPLDDFRFIVANHRRVYDFSTWPQAEARLNSGAFSFDLNGKGKVGEKVTITATGAGTTALAQETVNEGGVPRKVLGGLGDIGKGAWAQQTFQFEKPVWAFGVSYRSPDEAHLGRTGEGASFPVSYKLSDGTVVNLGAAGTAGGVLAAHTKTFVGVIDKTDKGISSVTVSWQGTAAGPQPLYIEDLAFALAGPPPGDWKLTMADEFDGDQLNPAHWATGYTFPDVINNELEGFVPENVQVANGLCSVKVDLRDCVNTDREGRKGRAQKIASGSFTSYDKFTQTYGYFEARIKMPKARAAGVWPAFWMLPDRGRDFQSVRGSYRTEQYGMGSEIDIFEFMPRWKRLDGLFPIHCGTIWSYSAATPQDPDPHGYGSYALANDGWGPEELNFPRLDSEFHTYGIYWSPQRLIFYVDSKPVFRVKDAKNIPDVPEYFLFNISVSLNGWGKNPGGSQPTYAQIIGDLPNAMQIDYFRAYSGVLEEDIPAAPEDLPVIRKYSPPSATTPPPAPRPATAEPAPAPSGAVPAAPINSTITTPANG